MNSNSSVPRRISSSSSHGNHYENLSENELKIYLQRLNIDIQERLRSIKAMESSNAELRQECEAMSMEVRTLEQEVFKAHGVDELSFAPPHDSGRASSSTNIKTQDAATSRLTSKSMTTVPSSNDNKDDTEADDSPANFHGASLHNNCSDTTNNACFSRQPRPRDLLDFAAPRLWVQAEYALEICGQYDLVSGLIYNRYPVWKMPNHDMCLFASSDHVVLFGEVDSFTRDVKEGIVASGAPHCESLPHEIKLWQRDDGVNWILDDTIAIHILHDNTFYSQERRRDRHASHDDENDNSSLDEDSGLDEDSLPTAGMVPLHYATMHELPSPTQFMRPRNRGGAHRIHTQ